MRGFFKEWGPQVFQRNGERKKKRRLEGAAFFVVYLSTQAIKT
jgi:hypothetical protein